MSTTPKITKPGKGGVATSLIDERVRVVIGSDPDKLNAMQKEFCERNKHEARGAWAYWGDYARVRAVYVKDGDLKLTLQRENCCELFDCYANHVIIAPAKN